MIEYVEQLSQTLQKVDLGQVDHIIRMIKRSQKSNGTVWIFGNGGSFANALHWSCDLTKVGMIRCGVLGSNGASLTAFSNDTSYSDAIMLELRRVARYGDLLIILSCSGCSPNVVRLLMESARLVMPSILITGSMNNVMKQASMVLRIQSEEYEIIEDCHAAIGHIITRELGDAKNNDQSGATRLHFQREQYTIKT